MKIIKNIQIAIFIFTIVWLGCQNGTETEECSDIICVTEYEGDIAITEYDAIMSGWMEDTLYWGGTINTDTVTIQIGGSCGDECVWGYILQLKDNGVSLPDFIRFSYIRSELMPEWETRDSLKSGTVAIQDWNNENIYSGKIEGLMSGSDSVNIVFWWENE